jgi:hypothetical protein
LGHPSFSLPIGNGVPYYELSRQEDGDFYDDIPDTTTSAAPGDQRAGVSDHQQPAPAQAADTKMGALKMASQIKGIDMTKVVVDDDQAPPPYVPVAWGALAALDAQLASRVACSSALARQPRCPYAAPHAGIPAHLPPSWLGIPQTVRGPALPRSSLLRRRDAASGALRLDFNRRREKKKIKTENSDAHGA